MRRSLNWKSSRAKRAGPFLRDETVSGHGRAKAAELKSSVAPGSDRAVESSLGRRGHLTLRFSADVFPRFSTSSN
jgi:hypothetical protein